jgi:hypothetical protein
MSSQPAPDDKRILVTVNLPEDAMSVLSDLGALHGSDMQGGLYSAIDLMLLVAREQAAGSRIIIQSRSGARRVLLPYSAWSRSAASSAPRASGLRGAVARLRSRLG